MGSTRRFIVESVITSNTLDKAAKYICELGIKLYYRFCFITCGQEQVATMCVSILLSVKWNGCFIPTLLSKQLEVAAVHQIHTTAELCPASMDKCTKNLKNQVCKEHMHTYI